MQAKGRRAFSYQLSLITYHSSGGVQKMRELLAKMVGKKLDMFCGGTSSLRGKLVKVDEGVAHMVDEDDQMFYISIERIIVFSETKTGEQRAGFVLGFRK